MGVDHHRMTGRTGSALLLPVITGFCCFLDCVPFRPGSFHHTSSRISIIVLDPSDFHCPACLERSTAQFKMVAASKKYGFPCCIINAANRNLSEETSFILSYQFSGWIKANEIDISYFTCDPEIRMFDPENGSWLLLFDGETHSIRKWRWPMNEGEIKEWRAAMGLD